MLISIFFFTTICLNLWEEKELQIFIYDRELNESNSNKDKSGNNQYNDVFKKSNTNENENHNNKSNKNNNKDNLPNNEEIKVKNSVGDQIKN